ncbi:MAG: hypothetical protein PHC92_00365 [Syntrophomonadaceae bacterium]|nr:hypothetical protein [Syntrophomonadaceae bacterium]MDD3022360.1 hypothetical protein [Syntrophomonadaceae bacterium]
MSEDAGKVNQTETKGKDIQMPDFAEVWKEIYYNNESDWARALKGFIGTETFVALLDKTLEQYLAYNKVSRQQMEKLSEKGINPTKKDVARVAELVISMEEKIDMMEFQLFDNFNKMTDSLLKMAEYQGKIRDEIVSLKKEIALIKNKLDKQENTAGEAKTGSGRSSKQKAAEPKPKKT